MRKIAFFDIDGTLTSEIDGSVPEDAAWAIARARENGHLMFLNTGRCFQNVEPRFRRIGWDGYVCGCGTNIYCGMCCMYPRPMPPLCAFWKLPAGRMWIFSLNPGPGWPLT